MQFTKYQRRAATWTLIALAAGLLVWLLAPVLMPFVVAWVLAYVLNPLVDRFDGLFKARVPRWLSVGVIEVVVILILVGIAMLIVPLFIKQVPEMARQLPSLFEKARVWVESKAARYGFKVTLDIGTVSAWISEYFQIDSTVDVSTKKNMSHSLHDHADTVVEGAVHLHIINASGGL